jgi:hypothetical protein
VGSAIYGQPGQEAGAEYGADGAYGEPDGRADETAGEARDENTVEGEFKEV